MKLPWSKPETRAASGYTEQILEAAIGAAAGDSEDAGASAAVSAVAGLVGRSFASALVAPASERTRALTPLVLYEIGEQLVRRGKVLFEIDVTNGVVELLSVDSWSTTGGRRRSSWTYRLEAGTTVSNRPADSVVHIELAVRAKQARILAARLETKLSQELKSPTGSILPIPAAPQGAQTEAATTGLRQQISKLRGGVAFLSSFASGHLRPDLIRPGSQTDWRLVRVGANPPESLVRLQEQANSAVYAAAGASPALFLAGSDSTALREAQRWFLTSFLLPTAKIVEAELSLKLDAAITLDFTALRASDVAAKARALAAIVASGLDIPTARKLTGLE